MNQQQPSQGGQELPPGAGRQPAPSPLAPGSPRPPNLRAQAIWGGLLAGMAIAIALAVVMHVIQQASPNGFSIGGSVFLVLFLGLIIGSGLGVGLAAAVPDSTADSPESHHATRTDQPRAP
jgi:hypothetical protein